MFKSFFVFIFFFNLAHSEELLSDIGYQKKIAQAQEMHSKIVSGHLIKWSEAQAILGEPSLVVDDLAMFFPSDIDLLLKERSRALLSEEIAKVFASRKSVVVKFDKNSDVVLDIFRKDTNGDRIKD